MQVVKKIATAILGYSKTKLGEMVESGTPVRIAKVYGIASTKETKTTTFGDSLKFGGQFKLENALTGDVFAGSELYLPRVCEPYLAGAMDHKETNADGTDKLDADGDPIWKTRPVEFAFWLIISKGTKKSADDAGFQWSFEPVLNEGRSDPLARLALAFGASKPAAPAAPTSDAPSASADAAPATAETATAPAEAKTKTKK